MRMCSCNLTSHLFKLLTDILSDTGLYRPVESHTRKRYCSTFDA
jgi:hypothetical protein